MALPHSSFRAVFHSILGLWLGLWTISGIAMAAGGFLILAMECYGWLYLGLWFSVTPAGVLQRLAIAAPSTTMIAVQSIIDALLHLPMSLVFIWCGFYVAAMAWITRKRLERRISSSERAMLD